MSNSLKNPGLGNSGSFGILMLVLVTRVAVIVFCAWNASLYYQILTSFFEPQGKFFTFLIGFVALVLWALLQVLEILPRLVRGSLGALALLIKAAERFRGLEVSKADNPLVASLKKQYNAFPQRWVGRIMLLCYGAFAVDMAIMLQYYKPFSVSFTGLSINWSELLWLAICLFTVDLAVFVWLLAEGGKAIFRPETQPTTSAGKPPVSNKPKEPTKSAAPKDAESEQPAQPTTQGAESPDDRTEPTPMDWRQLLTALGNGQVSVNQRPTWGQQPADKNGDN